MNTAMQPDPKDIQTQFLHHVCEHIEDVLNDIGNKFQLELA